MVEQYRQSNQDSLSVYYTQKFSQRYDELVEEGMEVNPLAAKQEGKPGRTKQSKGRGLLTRLDTYKDAYIRFTIDFAVPFDNNQAERDFRIAKVKQKVSGCFRSDIGAEGFAVIQSFIQTVHKHHVSIWDELVKVFQAPYTLSFALDTTE